MTHEQLLEQLSDWAPYDRPKFIQARLEKFRQNSKGRATSTTSGGRKRQAAALSKDRS